MSYVYDEAGQGVWSVMEYEGGEYAGSVVETFTHEPFAAAECARLNALKGGASAFSIIQSGLRVWTVGYFDCEDWKAVTDHSDYDAANFYCRYLNGNST